MYVKEKLLKIFKIKNVLLIIAAVALIFMSVTVIISLFATYHDDMDTFLHCKAMPDCIKWLEYSIAALVIVFFSRMMIGNAYFYSSYFEGSLDGVIDFSDLAKVTGKPAWLVRVELSLYRVLYMKKYSFKNIEGKSRIELFSKTTLCECKNCGAPVEKKDYFAGHCNYCGSSDVFAKVLAGDRFYSISSEVTKGHNNPSYYEKKNLDVQKRLFLCYVVAAIGVLVISAIAIIDQASKYNDKDYLNKTILNPDNHLYDYASIRSELVGVMIFFGVLAVIMTVLALRRAFRIKYVLEAEKTAKYFSTVEVPFIPAEEIPSVKSSKKRLGSVRGAIRRNYLDHCRLEMNEGTLKASLAKKIVKDTCPSCAAPIVGAASDTYVCQTCGNKIMGVIVKK